MDRAMLCPSLFCFVFLFIGVLTRVSITKKNWTNGWMFYCISLEKISASGSSTVAIDNKIEQAMDLVKSHLMFAVREEVEVLKERIDVLMERIAFLESENQILRAAATQVKPKKKSSFVHSPCLLFTASVRRHGSLCVRYFTVCFNRFSSFLLKKKS